MLFQLFGQTDKVTYLTLCKTVDQIVNSAEIVWCLLFVKTY